MNYRDYSNPVRTLGTGALLLWAVVGCVLPGQAQHTDADRSAQAIKMAVHLHLGATTVAKLAAQIGDQTGLAIEIEPMLAEHRLLVQMDGISAETALKTLADLNGWEILHPHAGHYRIRAIPVPSPRKIADVPDAFRMALPMAFRRYLGLEAEKDEMPQASAHGQFNDAHLRYLQDEENQRQMTFLHRKLLDMATKSLTEDLAPTLRDGHEHLYSALSEDQKDDMITLLVLNKLTLLDVDLLHGKLKPFQRDYNTAELTLKEGRMLMIGSTTQMNGGMLYEGFGAPIQSLEPPSASKP